MLTERGFCLADSGSLKGVFAVRWSLKRSACSHPVTFAKVRFASWRPLRKWLSHFAAKLIYLKGILHFCTLYSKNMHKCTLHGRATGRVRQDSARCEILPFFSFFGIFLSHFSLILCFFSSSRQKLHPNFFMRIYSSLQYPTVPFLFLNLFLLLIRNSPRTHVGGRERERLIL